MRDYGKMFAILNLFFFNKNVQLFVHFLFLNVEGEIKDGVPGRSVWNSQEFLMEFFRILWIQRDFGEIYEILGGFMEFG